MEPPLMSNSVENLVDVFLFFKKKQKKKNFKLAFSSLCIKQVLKYPYLRKYFVNKLYIVKYVFLHRHFCTRGIFGTILKIIIYLVKTKKTQNKT